MIRLAAITLLAITTAAAAPRAHGQAPAPTAACTQGLALPPGFCATVFADRLGHVRHMTVAGDGTVYANSMGGHDPGDSARPGLIVLRDTHGTGHADRIARPFHAAFGGTGVALYGGYVYLEDGARIVRHRLTATGADPRAEVVLSGLPTTGDHHSHTIVIALDGTLYVNSGSATNACQRDNRKAGAIGLAPCDEKAVRAGIWRYRADRLGQSFGPAARYASGIRNAVGMALDQHGGLFATQHGRDQLHENWPALYTGVQGQNLPAEELLQVDAGADYGWPECYFDPGQNRLVLAPEYGGDGGHATGPCAARHAPLAAYPAHWAPNDLAIYTGRQFPEAYRGGAFIAFHGSWNRAPGPQDGFNVVFQPLAQGRPAGAFVVFADGFAGPGKAAGNARYRPTGLAVGPDGALYISDDNQGRIWQITYRGRADAPVAAAAAVKAQTASPVAPTPTRHVALPTGISEATVAYGRRLYAGDEAGAGCAGCHGAQAQGTAVGPRLIDRQWLWSHGDPAGIRATIIAGVAHPKRFSAPMPAYGGTPLTPAQTSALAAYVWSIGHGGAL